MPCQFQCPAAAFLVLPPSVSAPGPRQQRTQPPLKPIALFAARLGQNWRSTPHRLFQKIIQQLPPDTINLPLEIDQVEDGGNEPDRRSAQHKYQPPL
jgi:hypothetical protein